MITMISAQALFKDRKFKRFDNVEEQEWKGPFYFVQGADTQFGFIARELEQRETITWEKEIDLSKKIVEQVNKMNPKPRFFVVCGDLCDAMPDTEWKLREQQEIDYKKVFEKLNEDIPLICVCGNHDVGNTPTKETIKSYNDSFGDDYYSFWCGGILFLVINSQFFFDSSQVPELADKQEQWLEQKLKEGQNKRIIIFQHIPWFLKSFDEEKSYFNLDPKLREKWLNKFKMAGVEAIFCGHYHQNAGGAYKGIDVVVTSAIGGQLGNDKSGARIVNVLENGVNKDKSTDDIVRELENLKRLLGEASKNGEEISVSKSQTSFFLNNNGHKSGYNNIKNEVEKNGKLIAKVQQKTDIVNGSKGPAKSVTKTEVEIPSKGIHNIIVENGPNLKLKSESVPGETHGGVRKLVSNTILQKALISYKVEKINNLLGMEYSPLDMAEYIYWTGDEKNVALMIEELLEEGFMSRQEAINFLQSIKYNLDFMQARDKGLKNVDKKASETIKKNSYQNPSNLVNHEKSEQEFSKMRNSIGFDSKFFKNFLKGTSSGDENENIVLERLKMADLLDKEYFLEEVIYQLARVMFSQSVTKGSQEAETALHKLIAFLQKEVKNGQISRNLEKKLLVVLFSALTDTLAEQTESTVDNKKESFSNSNDLFSNNLETSEVESSLGDASMRTDSIGKSLLRETKPNVADSLKNSE